MDGTAQDAHKVGHVPLLSDGVVVTSAGVANAIAAATGSVAVAGGLGAAAATVGIAAQHITAWQSRRASEALCVGASLAGMNPAEITESLLETPKGRELMTTCLTAASRAIDDTKIAVLGRLLVSGEIGTDAAIPDDSIFISKVVADIERPHLKVLDYLERQHPELPGHAWLARGSELVAVVGGTAGSIVLSTLLKHNLVEGWTWSQYSRVASSTRAVWGFTESTGDPVCYSLSTVGREILEKFRSAAEDDAA